jgi:DNA-binding transcriptional LysR family regulator
VRLKPRLRANSSLALQQALLQGLGLARIPLFVVSEDLKNGRLVRLLPEWELPDEGIFTVQTVRHHVPARTRVFVEFLAARFGQPPYWERGF